MQGTSEQFVIGHLILIRAFRELDGGQLENHGAGGNRFFDAAYKISIVIPAFGVLLVLRDKIFLGLIRQPAQDQPGKEQD